VLSSVLAKPASHSDGASAASSGQISALTAVQRTAKSGSTGQ
jgi:hypothetical protein